MFNAKADLHVDILNNNALTVSVVFLCVHYGKKIQFDQTLRTKEQLKNNENGMLNYLVLFIFIPGQTIFSAFQSGLLHVHSHSLCSFPDCDQDFPIFSPYSHRFAIDCVWCIYDTAS